MESYKIPPESLTQEDDEDAFVGLTYNYIHLDKKRAKDIRTELEKPKQKELNIKKRIGYIQEKKGYFPSTPELDLYGFGLPPPTKGLRTLWKTEHTAQKRQEQRIFEEKHGEIKTLEDQAKFERHFRLITNISPCGRSGASRTTSAVATPVAGTSKKPLPSEEPFDLASNPPTTRHFLPSISLSLRTPFRRGASLDITEEEEVIEGDEPAEIERRIFGDEPPAEEPLGDEPTVEYQSAAEEEEEQQHKKSPSPTPSSSSDEPPSPGPPRPPPPGPMAQQPTPEQGQIPNPRNFTGQPSDVARFARDLHAIKTLKPNNWSNDNYWIVWAATFINGTEVAQNWAGEVTDAHLLALHADQQVRDAGRASPYYSANWSDFIKAFVKRFEDKYAKDTARENMKTLKQRQGENIRDFYDRFREIANKSAMSDEDKFHAFKSKIHPGLAYKVASIYPEPATMEDWKNAAANIERQLEASLASSVSYPKIGASQAGNPQVGSSSSTVRRRVQFNTRPGQPRVTFQPQPPPYQAPYQPPSFASGYQQGPSISQGFPPPLSRATKPTLPSGLTTQSVGRLTNLVCYFCKQKGHYMRNCPQKKTVHNMTPAEIAAMTEHLLSVQEALVRTEAQPQPADPTIQPSSGPEDVQEQVEEDEMTPLLDEDFPGQHFYNQDE